MAHQIELNPVSHITVGTVGPAGKRVFYLQASRGSTIISLVIEKQQAAMLATSLESFLEELDEKYPRSTREVEESIWSDMRLKEPIEDLFRVGNMGLGYNEDGDQIVLVAYELVEEEDDDANVVSFWASRAQINSLINHARDIVASGRPICGNCARPIDPHGHFCPNRNGHKH